jgi:FKBP-type peptidyl-prolyl cis-trans isomerase
MLGITMSTSMRINKLIGVGVLGAAVLACSKEPEHAAPAKEAGAAWAEPKNEAEAKVTPEHAKKILPAVQGDAELRKRMDDTAAAIPKGPSPLISEVSTPPDVAGAPKDAVRTKSGLAYTILTPGTGDASPTATQTVRVHYSGWTPEGRLFDSSVSRHNPISFALTKTSEGWREALSTMKVGERRRVWLSEALAREDGLEQPPGPLVYELELLEIIDG